MTTINGLPAHALLVHVVRDVHPARRGPAHRDGLLAAGSPSAQRIHRDRCRCCANQRAHLLPRLVSGSSTMSRPHRRCARIPGSATRCCPGLSACLCWPPLSRCGRSCAHMAAPRPARTPTTRTSGRCGDRSQQRRHRPGPVNRVICPQSTQAASGLGGRPGREQGPHQPVESRRVPRFPQRGQFAFSVSRATRRRHCPQTSRFLNSTGAPQLVQVREQVAHRSVSGRRFLSLPHPGHGFLTARCPGRNGSARRGPGRGGRSRVHT
jgi:hypothetical protein